MRLRAAVSGFLILAGCATGATRGDGTAPPPGVASQAQSQPRPQPDTTLPPGAEASLPQQAPGESRTPAKALARAGPLFERLGGKAAITAVVDDFLRRVSKDERINARFLNADIPRLRGMLIDMICQAAGGPCQYTGRDMRAAHAGMQIAGVEFDALVQDLQGALDRLSVPSREQDDLLGVLAPMKSEVTQDGAGATADGSPQSPSVPSAPSPLPSYRPTAPAPAPVILPPASETRPPDPAAPTDPVVERAQAVREAASLLEKANTARLRGSRSFADQLFSSAELIVGPEAVADLAPLFREGAPPRVLGPPKTVPRDAPAQPTTVGNSDDEAPGPKSQRGSLTGTVVRAHGRPMEGLAVVTLEPASGKFSRPPARYRVIEQRNREFAPRVLAVPVGSTVGFPNFDAVYHNVFSRSRARPFDLGIYKGGQTREVVLDKEGVVHVRCNLHANMSATIVAVAAPHYTVADPQGRFMFRSLAPGRYRLRVWTERTDAPVVQNVEIKGEPNRATVFVANDGSAGPQTDKFGAPRGGAIRK